MSKSVRIKGTITSWNDEKGYGFVSPLHGDKQVFLHIKAFSNRSRRPEVNDLVTFALGKDRQGRPCAAKATLPGDKVGAAAPVKYNYWLIGFALLFLVVVELAALTGHVHGFLALAYPLLSVITYLAYALDKWAAERGAWRTAENSLHLLALVGGWPGALIAQQTVRHKLKKQAFLSVFRATVLLNAAAFVCIVTEAGREALKWVLS